MMKYIFCCLVLLGQAGLSFGQSGQDTLLVVPARSGLYFYHIVSKQETLYSLSRKYQVGVKELARFNQLSLNTPLKLYQLVKIPLNSHNLNQSAGASATSSLTPLYHKVMKGETLYHISGLYDKVPDALLKKWNHLNGNEVSIGQFLIVGWLNTGGEAAGNKPASAPPAGTLAPVQTGQGTVAAATPAKKAPPEKTPAMAPVKNEPGTVAATPAVPPKKTPPVKAPSPAKTASGGTSAVTSSDDNAFLNEVIAAENENRRNGTPAQGQRKVSSPSAHQPADMEAAGPADKPVKAASVAVQADEDAFSVGTPAPAGKSSGKKTKAVKKEETRTVAVAPSADHPSGKNSRAGQEVQKKVALAVPPQKDSPQKEEPAKTDSFALMLNRVTTGPGKAPTKAVRKTNTPKASMPEVKTSGMNTPKANTSEANATERDKTGDPATGNNATESNPSQAGPLPGQTPPVNAPAGEPAAAEPGPSATMPAVTDSLQLVPTVKSTFQQLFDTQTDHGAKLAMKKGAAGWFRSNVKPGSGSYYALCDDLPRGTVVKVTNPINQRSVLVKVLDVIPKQKDNYNLIIKLSDAAMGDLGTSQSRFWCEIRYPDKKN